MENVVKIEKGRFIMNMPLQAPVRSKSGKTFIVLSTHGFASVLSDDGEEYQLSLNLIKRDKKPATPTFGGM